MEGQSPFEMLGGREAVLALSEAFYDAMERDEPELTAVHRLAAPGRVDPEVRRRFGFFLVYWLGGPEDYLKQCGHPRLRMRHMHVAIDSNMRDAWLRSMSTAMDRRAVHGEVRTYLDKRFEEVADFMRNAKG